MHISVMCVLFFFKQKTAYEMRISDWSSDVCSSDLEALAADRHLRVSHRLEESAGLPEVRGQPGQLHRQRRRGTGQRCGAGDALSAAIRSRPVSEHFGGLEQDRDDRKIGRANV